MLKCIEYIVQHFLDFYFRSWMTLMSLYKILLLHNYYYLRRRPYSLLVENILFVSFSPDTCWGQVLHTLISTYYACLLSYPRNVKEFITMAGFLSLLQLRVLGCNVEKHDKTKHFKDLEKKVEAYINP